MPNVNLGPHFDRFVQEKLAVLRDNQDAMSASIRMRLRGWILG
jgi:hypothetical protein